MRSKLFLVVAAAVAAGAGATWLVRLPHSPDDHRRVLAVVTYLDSP